eukprot:4670782-Alexandrium_andersonii.AAC.1
MAPHPDESRTGARIWAQPAGGVQWHATDQVLARTCQATPAIALCALTLRKLCPATPAMAL